MEGDHAIVAVGEEVGLAPHDVLTGEVERDPLHGAHGLPAAGVAERVFAAQHDSALLLRLATDGRTINIFWRDLAGNYPTFDKGTSG